MQRLSKILASRGVASRRGCEEIISEKRVKVNGTLVTVPQTMVAESAHITVDGMDTALQKKVYFILNKPKGYVCSNSPQYKKRVLDLFQNVNLRLFTVGRLDKNTKGLLIVTNDGKFANDVIHPSRNLEKEYLVKTSQNITHDDLLKIADGAFIEKKLVKPTFVKKVRKGTVKIGIKEGKKHEVRILIKKAKLKIVELKRIRIGPLVLGTLQEGYYREMRSKEIDLFLKTKN
jgi:23S rRNA pseudouridine2605 synthase